MNKNIHELLAEKIESEMGSFRASYKDMSTQQTYNDWYIIGFYEEYYEMLSTDYLEGRNVDDMVEWLAQHEKPLEYLYKAWMDSSGAFSHNWEDMLDWVRTVYDEEKQASVSELIDSAKERSSNFVGNSVEDRPLDLD